MSINLDVLIDTPEHSVDMKTGLETLLGVSDATRSISETVLTGHVPKKQNAKSNVRTNLKQSFKGSYGHEFSVEIYDGELLEKYKKIGSDVFAELMTYYINESLYIETPSMSIKAQNIVDGLGDLSEELILKLRSSSMRNIHAISRNFHYSVKIRHKTNRLDKNTIAIFDENTEKCLEAKPSNKTIDLTASITRLNINTGNGRLLLEGATETIAFGFGIEYKDVRLEAKKKFSENLDHNNGLDSNDWVYLRIRALPIILRDGKIVKYIVKGLING